MRFIETCGWRAILPAALIVCSFGCGGSDAEQEPIDPKYAKVEVRISNHQFGDSNGCTATFSPQTANETVNEAEMTCGHPGAVSKVRWKYVRSDRAGDHYTISRMFPSDAPVNTTVYKDVVFAGEELVVFEDDVQRVLMRPVME